MTCAKATNEEKALIQSTLKFEEFWRHSCYHLEEDAPKKSTMTELNMSFFLSKSYWSFSLTVLMFWSARFLLVIAAHYDLLLLPWSKVKTLAKSVAYAIKALIKLLEEATYASFKQLVKELGTAVLQWRCFLLACWKWLPILVRILLLWFLVSIFLLWSCILRVYSIDVETLW